MSSPSSLPPGDIIKGNDAAEPGPPSAPASHHLPSHSRRQLILALRYFVSQKEYAALRKRLKNNGPVLMARLLPSRREFDMVIREQAWQANMDRKDFDILPGTIRTTLRVFFGTKILLEIWNFVLRTVKKQRGAIVPKQSHRLFRSPGTLAAFSVSTLLLLHRLLSRFFSRLRANLLLPSAKTFRRRHPKAAKLLTSPFSPAVGASLAGLSLALYPAGDTRTAIAAYALTKAFEYTFNLAELRGVIRNRPWWLGSWLLFPITSAQLLHSFVFDRDCFPAEYGNFIMKYSTEYIPTRPETYPEALPWPGAYDIVDGIANVAKAKYPPFISPILNPLGTTPSSVRPLSPVFSPAHPLINSLHCAIVHPVEPSCSKTYLQFVLNQFPRICKLLAIIYAIFSLPRYRQFLHKPITFLNRLGKSTLMSALFITGAIGTSWSSLCLFQRLFPRNFWPKERFYLAGFLGGLWAYVDYTPGRRSSFLYSLRLGLISAWRVGVKKGWVRNIKNGDVCLFVLALAAANCIYEVEGREAITDGWVRNALKTLRGESQSGDGDGEGRSAGAGTGAGVTADGRGKAVARGN